MGRTLKKNSSLIWNRIVVTYSLAHVIFYLFCLMPSLDTKDFTYEIMLFSFYIIMFISAIINIYCLKSRIVSSVILLLLILPICIYYYCLQYDRLVPLCMLSLNGIIRLCLFQTVSNFVTLSLFPITTIIFHCYDKKEFKNLGNSVVNISPLKCKCCGSNISDMDEFCQSCGTKLKRVCPMCNTLDKENELFCINCGYKF